MERERTPGTLGLAGCGAGKLVPGREGGGRVRQPGRRRGAGSRGRGGRGSVPGSTGGPKSVSRVGRTCLRRGDVDGAVLSTGGCAARETLKAASDPFAPRCSHPASAGAAPARPRGGVAGSRARWERERGTAPQPGLGWRGKGVRSCEETSSHLRWALLSFFKQKAFLNVDLRTLTCNGDGRQNRAIIYFRSVLDAMRHSFGVLILNSV